MAYIANNIESFLWLNHYGACTVLNWLLLNCIIGESREASLLLLLIGVMDLNNP